MYFRLHTDSSTSEYWLLLTGYEETSGYESLLFLTCIILLFCYITSTSASSSAFFKGTAILASASASCLALLSSIWATEYLPTFWKKYRKMNINNNEFSYLMIWWLNYFSKKTKPMKPEKTIKKIQHMSLPAKLILACKQGTDLPD